MFPCITPSLCGVQSHRNGTLCKGQQRRSNKFAGAPRNDSSLSSPQSASSHRNDSSLSADETEKRSGLLRDYMDNNMSDSDHATLYGYNPEEMSVAYLVTRDTGDETETPLMKGQYVVVGLETDDDSEPEEIFNESSTDVEDSLDQSGWTRY